MTARAVFMGSDDFSVPILEMLLERGPGLEVPVCVAGVATQPDRPAGRGRKVVESPVKTAAARRGIPVFQPERVRDSDAVHAIQGWHPDVIVVASFGQILPASLLAVPRRGVLNLHPSLLPRYRGPSPVVAPILAGDTVTGTTLMLMELKMDAGPILDQRETPIGPNETGGELRNRLALASAQLLAQDLPRWLKGEIEPRPQDEEQATYTRRLAARDGLIDWTQSAEALARQVRAFNPWPSAFTFWVGRRLRLLRAQARAGRGALPGRVAGGQEKSVLIGTGDGVLAVEQLQLEGGKPLPAPDFLRGHPDLVGARLGVEGAPDSG